MAKKKVVTKKAEAETQAALDAVENIDVNDIVSEFGGLQVKLQKTLADMSATITGKLSQMQQIDAAIVAKETQLQELYDIEREAMSLEAIRAEREADEQEAEQKRMEEDAKAKENQQERNKKWAREEEEHLYAINKRNQRADEEYRALVERHQREEKIRQDTLERNWTERETVLKAQENEVVDLRAKVADIDNRVKAEVSKAEKILENTLKKHYEQEIRMLQRDVESKEALHASEVKGLRDTISGLSDQIERLQGELDRARADAKEVTAQALQATSDRKVAEALRNVVENQPQGGKSK